MKKHKSCKEECKLKCEGLSCDDFTEGPFCLKLKTEEDFWKPSPLLKFLSKRKKNVRH